MEFFSYPSPPPPPASSSPSCLGIWVDQVIHTCNSTVSTALGKMVSAILTFSFAVVGVLLGAMTGALIGQETESGFFRGAAIGAISGAVFSIEVFESSLLLWSSENKRIGCVLYLVDVIASLLSGRLVRERIGPAMLNAVQSQMGAIEMSFDDTPDIFGAGGAKGLSSERVEMLPKIKITTKNKLDISGDGLSCSVCLQDFQIDETVRCLPECHHMFHRPCIDKWLMKQGSCPLCRRDL